MELKEKYSYSKGRYFSVSAAVERTCDGDREGIAESAQATASNVVAKLGELIELLADKGLLNSADIQKLLSAYEVVQP